MYDWCKCNGILHLAGKVLTDYTQEYVLQEVCRSDLYLQDSLKSKIIVYRSKIGEPEHYAIVIGEPAIENIVVRLHSSCYTGDLLGSLSCDCRSQLLTAVKLLAEQAGGIILYISQEGRGIGLANKIRAYSLQMQNSLDTVDANRFLGFDDDERIFLPAAMILRNLGVSSLQLLTNNPHKVQEIGKYGFDVTKTIPFHMEINEYNGNYIKTKQTRLGHTN
nr:GTP cyclohydrolase II [Anaplasma phagocytophilum]